MVLRALGSADDVSQRRQVERLHGLDGRCTRTFCADGHTTAACQRTGLPRFGDWGFDAEVTPPFHGLAWSELAGELRCGPVVFGWDEAEAGDQGHMVVMTSARELTVDSPGRPPLRLGPWIAVNDPAGGAARTVGACSASYEVWSYAHYRRMTPRIHYYGFRPVGEPYRSCPRPVAHGVAGILEGSTAAGVVAKLLEAVNDLAEETERRRRDEDFAWLTEALALPASAPWSCEPVGVDGAGLGEAGDRRSFLCMSRGIRFYLDVVLASSGGWRLAAFEREVTTPDRSGTRPACSSPVR